MSSGKFVVRTGSALHEELKNAAKQSAQSLNQVCIDRLSRSSEPSPYRFLQNLPFKTVGLMQYGSVVRKEQTASSDIDWLLIVGRDVVIERGLYRLVDESPLPRPKISLHISHLPRPGDDFSNFWLELALEAEILLDPQGVIHRTLISIRREIAAGFFQRFLTHGQPYWINRRKNAQSKTR